MSDDHVSESFLRRPRKSSEDYWQFVNLAGEIEVFDIATASYPWFGRRIGPKGLPAEGCIEGSDGVVCDRRDELLYLTSDGRYVLVYCDRSSLGDAAKPWPDRELSPSDASLWFMLSEHELPAPLKPVPLRDPAQDPSRLNRSWTPCPDGPPEPEGENERRKRDGSVIGNMGKQKSRLT